MAEWHDAALRQALHRGGGFWRVLTVALLLGLAGTAMRAQTPQQHEQHHPADPSSAASPGGQQTSMPAVAPAQPGGVPASGMPGMAGMGEGQRCCGGAPPPSALYPALMAVPELTPERRREFDRDAADRLAGGVAMMAEAFARLDTATAAADAAAMQEANAQLREGLAQFESGVALRRALNEGRAPRDVALEWFRREMHLVPLTNRPAPHGLFGLSWFHYVVMATLVVFALATVGMQFSKMRRAEALVARLAPSAPATTLLPVVPSVAPAASTGASLATAPDAAPSRSNSWTGLLRVARVFDETPNVKTFRLINPSFGALPFTYLPGQFLTVTASIDEQTIKRSYTISSSPSDRGYCEITVKREEHGAVSRFLHDQIHEDDALQVTAPSGRFTFTGEEATSLVLIAGGVGVTPMMSVLRHLTQRSWLHDIYFLFAVRAEADIIFREELDYLQRRYRNLHVVVVVDQLDASANTAYVRGRITRELLETRVPDLPTHRIHVCGPPPMMSAVKALLIELGVPTDHIHTEVFQGAEPRRQTLDTVPPAQTQIAVATFARSKRTALLPPTKTLLEAAEDVGVRIDYSCRIGTCGVCRTKLLSGVVTMDVEDGLEPGDKANHVILACQAKATADVVVDA